MFKRQGHSHFRAAEKLHAEKSYGKIPGLHDAAEAVDDAKGAKRALEGNKPSSYTVAKKLMNDAEVNSGNSYMQLSGKRAKSATEVAMDKEDKAISLLRDKKKSSPAAVGSAVAKAVVAEHTVAATEGEMEDRVFAGSRFMANLKKRRSNSPAKKGKKSSPKKDGSSKRGPRSPSTYNTFVKKWFANHPGKNVKDHASDMARDWQAKKALNKKYWEE